MTLGVILLAAGGSSRMGGPHKLLLPWGEQSVVAQSLTAALGAPVALVVVVTGFRGAEVEQACRLAAADDERLHFAPNPRWGEGMYTSVLEGLAHLPPELDGFFVALGDMPMIPARAYADLAASYVRRPGHIIIPTWEGRRGHPVLFPTGLLADLPPATSDEGLRGVLRRFPELVVEVPVPYPGVCLDLDTPEEYVRYLDSHRPTES